MAVNARTIPLCSPHGVFTGCSWSINARGARKLIIHTSQLIWSRTYVTVWWISCPMQGSTNIVQNSLGTVRTGVMRMGHYLNTIGNLKIHGFMQYLGNLFLYNWIVVCGAVHWHGLLVLSMARSNFSYCSSPTVHISSWLLCGFGQCHWWACGRATSLSVKPAIPRLSIATHKLDRFGTLKHRRSPKSLYMETLWTLVFNEKLHLIWVNHNSNKYLIIKVITHKHTKRQLDT